MSRVTEPHACSTAKPRLKETSGDFWCQKSCTGAFIPESGTGYRSTSCNSHTILLESSEAKGVLLKRGNNPGTHSWDMMPNPLIWPRNTFPAPIGCIQSSPCCIGQSLPELGRRHLRPEEQPSEGKKQNTPFNNSIPSIFYFSPQATVTPYETSAQRETMFTG